MQGMGTKKLSYLNTNQVRLDPINNLILSEQKRFNSIQFFYLTKNMI